MSIAIISDFQRLKTDEVELGTKPLGSALLAPRPIFDQAIYVTGRMPELHHTDMLKWDDICRLPDEGFETGNYTSSLRDLTTLSMQVVVTRLANNVAAAPATQIPLRVEEFSS